ncbi:MAG: class I SAM-dependent methyltransferase [Candidatus Saganbacteria bacterium]|nr:class I SAM-dependent methyltransferase [Candidatus Saganbacteria bacterium]
MQPDQEKCNLCSSGEFSLIKDSLRDDKERFKVYQCSQCGHIQLLPKPTEEDDKAFYDKNLQDKNRNKQIDLEKLQQNQRYDTDRHVELIRSLAAKDKSILDIGAGYGFFVSALIKSGFKKAKGLEISSERRELALGQAPGAILGHDVKEGPEVIGRYDVVTLFHVLEHVADPIAFLKDIKALLKPGGIFICEVPNVRDLLLDNSKEYHDFYWIRAHLNYFDDKGLSFCLKQAGFAIESVRSVQRYGLLNLSNWLMYGKPQIEKPVFSIDPDYEEAEAMYRKHVESKGRGDALVAIAKNK